MSDEQAQPSFEESLERIEAIVEKLESGDLTLEQSLALFEQGVSLTGRCRKQLDEAETRVEILMRRGTERVAESFELKENGG